MRNGEGGGTPVWHKSRYSIQGGPCVEVAEIGALVGVRDSENPESALTFPWETWRRFVADLKMGAPGYQQMLRRGLTG